jgi:hypothetical protein
LRGQKTGSPGAISDFSVCGNCVVRPASLN